MGIINQMSFIRKSLAVAAVAAAVMTSCSHDPIYNTPHPEHGTITLTTDWANTNVGRNIAIPSHTVAVGGYSAILTGTTNTIGNLFDPGTYRADIYNTADQITIDGSTASVTRAVANSPEIYVHEMPGWLYTYTGNFDIEKDKVRSFTATMIQQVRELNLVVEPRGGNTGKIGSIEAHVSGVASQLNIEDGTPGGEAKVHSFFTKSADGKWVGTMRLLGIIPTASQNLLLVIKYDDPALADEFIYSDLSAALVGFNDQKQNPKTLGSQAVQTPTGPDMNITLSGWEEVILDLDAKPRGIRTADDLHAFRNEWNAIQGYKPEHSDQRFALLKKWTDDAAQPGGPGTQPTGTVRLLADIDLGGNIADPSTYWTPIGYTYHFNEFKAAFDGAKPGGGNYKISGLVVKKDAPYNDESHAGLFGSVGFAPGDGDNSSVRISNLTIDGAHVEAEAAVAGILAGATNKDVTIENINVSGTVSGAYNIGGIVGFNNGNISMCSVGEGSVISAVSHTAGGIAGPNFGKISLCYSLAREVKATFNLGGIAGSSQNLTDISDCFWLKYDPGQPDLATRDGTPAGCASYDTPTAVINAWKAAQP